MPALPAKKYLSSVTSGNGGYTLLPEAPGDLAATLAGIPGVPWVAGIGDLNGDGIPDVIVGAPGSDDKAVDAGRIFVAMGKAAGTAATTLGDKLTEIIIDGITAGDLAGATVGSIGDLNGDLRPDLLIGAPLTDRAGVGADAGAGFVVWSLAGGGGIDLGDPASGGGKGFVMRGQAAGDRAGSAMASIADLNGDGRPDVLIGAPGSDAGGSDSGAAYVVFGKSSAAAVNLSSVAAGTGGFRITGQAAGDDAGSALASVADMNGDGLAEIVVGASGSDAGGVDSGAVYVVFGKASTTAVDLNAVAGGTGGFRITGATAGALTGRVVTGLGDINADGLGDILIGAPGENAAYVVFGKATTTEINLAALGSGGYKIIAEHAGDLSALSVSGGRDINHDGIVDLVIGASHNNEGGTDAGAVYAIWGGGSSVVDLSMIAAGMGGAKIVGVAGSLAGSSVAVQADMNGDGAAEIIVGSPGGFESVSVVYADPTWQPDLNVYGTNGDDVIGAGYGGYHVVGDGNDSILGLGGNDSINAAGGQDTIDGGTGNDTIDGGLGNDTLLGDAGLDVLLGNAGNDLLDGGINNDLLNGGAGNDTLIGGTGADTMLGGAGNDVYYVDSLTDVVTESGGGIDQVISGVNWTLGGNVEKLSLTGTARIGTGNTLANTIVGTSGDDLLSGVSGNDTLNGGFGNDTLNGGTGIDNMAGGGGNDVYFVDTIGDTVVEAPDSGFDTVLASLDWTLGDGQEALVLSGLGHAGTGNGLDNVITGQAGSDTLDGGGGNDTLIGGTGADLMIGGTGDDVYYVDNLADVVQEGVDGGTDTVIASVNWTMSANVESVRLTGAAHVMTGNAQNNSLVGASGNDTLDGGEGNDILLGGDGNDRLISSSGMDTLAGGSGDDRYQISGGHVRIEDLLGHDTLDAGGATGDSYIDLSGDTLSHIENEDCELGQGGSTVMPLDVQFLQDLTGSFGDDIATVRGVIPGIIGALQAVQPNSRFGSSTFVDKPVGPFGSAGEWTYNTLLPLTGSAAALTGAYTSMVIRNGADAPEAQLEALMQLALRPVEVGFRTDSARFVVLFTDAPFHIAGDGAAAGILTPNNGDAIINGTPPGTGEDYPMIAQVKSALQAANIIPIFAIAGGYESTYQGLVSDLGRGTVVTLTSNSSNVVAAVTAGLTAATTTSIEDAVGGVGNDTIKGSVVSNTLSGGAGNDMLDGDAGDDTLLGSIGNDTLVGGTGADTMSGGIGNDTYYVDNAGDLTVEAAKSGTDTVIASVDWVLAINLEVLTLSGLAFLGTGNEAANRITAADGGSKLLGLGGNDTLVGGAGTDTLIGGLGADTLTGGGGADVFGYTTATEGGDRITDFSALSDTLEVSATGFGSGLTDGMDLVASQRFVIGAAANQAFGQFTYSSGTGRLSWDADGTGIGASVSIAVLTGAPVLTGAELHVVV